MRRLLGLFFASALAAASAAQAQVPRSDAPEKTADSGDKIVCKRFARTGSLADSYKTCKTKHEWERERDNVRQLSVVDSCRDRANGGAGCD
jgi:hypothetical protein